MVLNAHEEALLGEPATDQLQYDHQRIDHTPSERKKIGKWTLVALILNRTIGSGIFLAPHNILAGTGSIGGALFCWVLGGLISLCGLYVWLECGLSMPQRRVGGESEPRGVPRSGGEKNFLEFMFPNPKLRLPHIRTTCSFAIMFVLMYNLSGNALSFGLMVMTASGIYTYDPENPEIVPDRGIAIGIAIGALTFVVLIHMFSRRGGILLNNAFAVVKVALLLAIICLGISKAAGRFGGPGDTIRNNFTKGVFETRRTDVASWSNSLMFCMYAFSGYEQPFYILAEAKSPRKYFPKYTVLALIFAIVLFLLVNISFLLVVDVDLDKVIPPKDSIPLTRDMATLFFDHLFEDSEKASRAMAGLIALSIFGKLIVMTFTAARVKQEIAKEGILPSSLFFATCYATPHGLLKKWKSSGTLADAEIERAPTAAFGLHWFTSVLLIAVTAPILDPRKSYSTLVSLYSYTIVSLLGCWVSFGLIRIKMQKSRWHWQERRRYRPWLSPIHPIIYGVVTAFMLIGAFIPPKRASPYHQSVTGFSWYIVPAIGITAPLWGVLWYWGLLIYSWRIGRQLEVRRDAYWMQDPDYPGEFVQHAEIIDHIWPIIARRDMCDDFSQPQVERQEMKDNFVMSGREAIGGDDSSGFEDGRERRANGFEDSRERTANGFGDNGRNPLTTTRRLPDGFDA